jgi:mercuric ion binding protein
MKMTNRTNIRKRLFLLLFISLSFAAFAGNETVKIKTSAECETCKNRIELAVNQLSGIKKVSLSIATKVLLVKYDPKKVSLSEIKIAISNAGYQADDIPANPDAYNVLPTCCKVGGHQ